MSMGPYAARKAGNVPMYACGVPAPPKDAATRGYPDASSTPSARIERSFSATMPSASSHEIGTKPGSSWRPLRGFVRFIGDATRFGW
jgi:hypothetical protein